MALSPDQLRAKLRGEAKENPEPVVADSPIATDTPDYDVAAAFNGGEPPAQNNSFHVEPPRERPTAKGSRKQRENAKLVEAPEIERIVIGLLYVYPNQCFPEFIEHGRPEFFANVVCRKMFDLMHGYYLEHGRLETMVFLQHVTDTGQAASIGGPRAFGEVAAGSVAPVVSLPYYIDLLRDKYVAREASRLSADLSHKLGSVTEDELWEVISEHERAIGNLRGLASDKLDGVENFNYADLVGFESAKDPTTLLGTRRWLGKGYTCLWAGGSGYGKSTLEMQAALYWGTGTPLFGIPAVRPLKSLIIQAENDLGDTAEQFQGVLAGIKATGDFKLNGQVERMIRIERVIGVTGDKFLAVLRTLIKMNKPDLVWIDPFFAFAGCDLIDTEKVSAFIREGIIPIAVEHGVCIHVIHHISKPARDNDDKKNWSAQEYQYLGFGSSEIQNSFRAVNVLIPVSGYDGVFKLVLAKRGSRAGAKSTEGEQSNMLFLSHAKEGLLWTQVPEPDEQPRGAGKRYDSKFTPDDVLAQMSVMEPMKTTALQRHVCGETGMVKSTFYRLFTSLKDNQKVRVTESGWIPNTKR